MKKYLLLILVLIPQLTYAQADIYFTDGSICRSCDFEYGHGKEFTSVTSHGQDVTSQYKGKEIYKIVALKNQEGMQTEKGPTLMDTNKSNDTKESTDHKPQKASNTTLYDLYFTDGTTCFKCNYLYERDKGSVISVVDQYGTELINQYQGKTVKVAAPPGMSLEPQNNAQTSSDCSSRRTMENQTVYFSDGSACGKCIIHMCDGLVEYVSDDFGNKHYISQGERILYQSNTRRALGNTLRAWGQNMQQQQMIQNLKRTNCHTNFIGGSAYTSCY